MLFGKIWPLPLIRTTFEKLPSPQDIEMLSLSAETLLVLVYVVTVARMLKSDNWIYEISPALLCVAKLVFNANKKINPNASRRMRYF